MALSKYCRDVDTSPLRKDCIPFWMSVRGESSSLMLADDDNDDDEARSDLRLSR